MTRIIVFITAGLILIWAGCGQKEVKEVQFDMSSLLPTEVAGWEATESPRKYDFNGIFEYMDGPGEVYRMYDYREMRVLRMEKPDHPGISIELFDMGKSHDAYGIFSHSREKEDADAIGQGSSYDHGMLYFWQDRYFAAIQADRETDDTRAAISEIGKTIASNISKDGPKPAILGMLPDDGLQPETVKYFHLYTSLNYHYYLTDQNVLKLSTETEAVLAKYTDENLILVIIEYPDEQTVSEAVESFSANIESSDDSPGTFQLNNGKWGHIEGNGKLIMLALDAPDSTSAAQLVGLVKIETS